jgi:hypothetical protein
MTNEQDQPKKLEITVSGQYMVAIGQGETIIPALAEGDETIIVYLREGATKGDSK